MPREAVAESLYSRIVDDVRAGSVTTAELALIAGVGERQVQNWASGANRPSGPARDRLLEVNYIVGLLRDIYTEEGIDIWLHARNRAFSGEKPIDLLKAGAFQDILLEIERLRHGAV